MAKIAELRRQLVSFNGHSFDLPVLRYRAMLHELSAPGLAARSYYNRYTEDALDLCGALSSFDGRLKIKLDDLCKGLGLRGKANGLDGSHVERMVAEELISEVADYCECDVVCTYQVWLRYQLFTQHTTQAVKNYIRFSHFHKKRNRISRISLHDFPTELGTRSERKITNR